MGIKKVLKNKKMGDIVTSFTMPLLTIVFVSILLFMFLNTTKQDKIADDRQNGKKIYTSNGN